MGIAPLIAIFIPIIFLIGLFIVISFNIYYRYKTNTEMSQRVPLESLGEWYKSQAYIRANNNRGNSFRWGGFFTGMGLGTAAGLIIILCNNIAIHSSHFDGDAVATFLIISIAILGGGLGMIGAYFLERSLDRKSK